MEHLGLLWSIKRSFIRYVARAEGSQVLGGRGLVMADASTFVFPPDDDGGGLAFRGELRLQAHGGALSLRIANPHVDLSEPRSTMTIDDPEGSSRRVPLVTFITTKDDTEDVRRWTGRDVRLAVEAVPLFGGYYGEDEPFDDLAIAIMRNRP